MRIFGISDLHLSFNGAKPMDLFGDWWKDHTLKVESAWRERVGEDDLVLLPGDFSWSMKIAEVGPELSWLAALPGKKVLLKGNHDYWWGSASKMRALLPGGVYALNGGSLNFDGVWLGGARGWLDPRLDFDSLSGHSTPRGEDGGPLSQKDPAEDRRIYERELEKLETSLKAIDPDAKLKVALLHYPPAQPDLGDTEVTGLLEKYKVDIAVFGHLHRSGTTDFKNPFGEKNGIRYYLVSADFIDFKPEELWNDG